MSDQPGNVDTCPGKASCTLTRACTLALRGYPHCKFPSEPKLPQPTGNPCDLTDEQWRMVQRFAVAMAMEWTTSDQRYLIFCRLASIMKVDHRDLNDAISGLTAENLDKVLAGFMG